MVKRCALTIWRIYIPRVIAGFQFLRDLIPLRTKPYLVDSLNIAAKHRDGGFWQNESAFGLFRDDGCDWRPIGIGMTVLSIIFPDVLLTAKSHQRDGA
jgi:hypothetical protein